MPISPIQEFTDYMRQAKPVYLSGPDVIVNHAQARTTILGRMLKKGKEYVQYGPKIQDIIYTQPTGQLEWYAPGSPTQYVLAQTGTPIEIGYRHSRLHMAWNEVEIQNQAGGNTTKNYRMNVYKRVQRNKEVDLAQRLVNGIEDSLLASPHGQAAQMEGDGGLRPYSLFCWLNEEANGLPDGWATIMGVNPNATPSWRCEKVTYNVNDIFGTNGDGRGLLVNMHRMLRRTTFTKPGLMDENFRETQLGSRAILASDLGMDRYNEVLLDRGDRLRNNDDPGILSPMCAGVPLVYIEGWGNAAVWPGTARSTENAATVTVAGPRYGLVNFDVLKLMCHGDMMFKKRNPIVLQNQQDTTVQETVNWMNTYCTAPRELALLSPATN